MTLDRGPLRYEPAWERPPELTCGRCKRRRHVLDLVAHVIGPDERRCRNYGHLRCRDGCEVVWRGKLHERRVRDIEL